MTVRSRSLVVALAVALAASVVVAPVATAAGSDSPPTTNAADAAATSAAADTAAYPHSFWDVLPEPADSCTPAFGVVDATTNATTVASTVGFADDTPEVGGALAAVGTAGTTGESDENAVATRTRRLQRRLALPSTPCGTR